MESLSEKLRSFGVIPTQGKAEEKSHELGGIEIQDALPGIDIDTPYGKAYLVESEHSVPDHENKNYAQSSILEVVARWAGLPELSNQCLGDFLFLDTETSGLSGGTGTFAFMIGLGCWTAGKFQTKQLFMRDPADEKALLIALNQLTGQYKTIVTFNGKSFDIPLLKARHVLHDLAYPFVKTGHIDLLPMSRRIWRNRLPRRTLKDLESSILDISRSQEDMPGWMIPEIYFEYLKSGDAKPLTNVFYHNAQDILSLGRLFNHISGLLANPLEESAGQSLDLIAIGKLFEDLGKFESAIELYKVSLTQGLPLPFFVNTLMRFAHIYKMQSRWLEAYQLWQQAAEYHQVDACIEIAKWMEHHQQDISGALKWVESAEQYLPEIAIQNIRIELQRDLENRKKRLLKKQ